MWRWQKNNNLEIWGWEWKAGSVAGDRVRVGALKSQVECIWEPVSGRGLGWEEQGGCLPTKENAEMEKNIINIKII